MNPSIGSSAATSLPSSVRAPAAAPALGAGSAGDLGPENLRALDQEAAALTGVPLAGYDAPLPMWRH